MEILFNYDLNGSHGTIKLTRQQWEGLCILNDEMQRYGQGYLKLEEMLPIPNIDELVKNKLKSILENTLEEFSQFTYEQVRSAINHTFYHKYENFSFLWGELENVNFLTFEQVEASVRNDEFFKKLINEI